MYLYSKLRFLHVTFFKKLQDGGRYGGSGMFLFLVTTYMRVFDFFRVTLGAPERASCGMVSFRCLKVKIQVLAPELTSITKLCNPK